MRLSEDTYTLNSPDFARRVNTVVWRFSWYVSRKTTFVYLALLNSRIPVLVQALVDTLKVKVSIHTTYLDPHYIASCTKDQSHLISRRTSSGRAFLPSRKLAHFRTASRYWDERFLLLEPISIYFGCFLSRNAEIIFLSTTTVNCPSPVIAAAT